MRSGATGILGLLLGLAGGSLRTKTLLTSAREGDGCTARPHDLRQIVRAAAQSTRRANLRRPVRWQN